MNDNHTERPEDRPRRWRRALVATAAAGGLAAGAVLVAGGGGISAVQLAGSAEDLSGPCDEAEHAQDPRCTDATTVGDRDDDDDRTTSTTAASRTTTPTSVAGSAAGATTDVRSFDAAGAGTVTYEVLGSSVSLVSAIPSAGWRVEVEQAAGDEIDLDFRSGSRRVQVDVEWEDGAPRERVRLRDDADDTDIRTEDGLVVRDDSDDDSDDRDDEIDDDNSGHGSDDDDDRSGSNSGSDDDDDEDDDDNSGRDHPEDD